MNMSIRKALYTTDILRSHSCVMQTVNYFTWSAWTVQLQVHNAYFSLSTVGREEKGDLTRAMWIQCITQIGGGKWVQNFNRKR